MIRPYRQDDAAVLAQIFSAHFPQTPLSAAAFHAYLGAARARGRVWIIDEGGAAGYAAAFPVPGLPHIVDLDGAVAPPRQREGLGSRLLARVKTDLHGTAVRQISYRVREDADGAVPFLLHNGFGPEHEEWFLELADPAATPAVPHVAGLAVRTRPRPQAIALFQDLYDASFAGLPWAQPYSAAEVALLLAEPEDLLFLEQDGRPAGFAWLRYVDETQAQIEPLGIVRGAQGRGYGRALLLHALRELAQRGARRVQIGVWRSNEAALALYTAVGFRHTHTVHYLACYL